MSSVSPQAEARYQAAMAQFKERSGQYTGRVQCLVGDGLGNVYPDPTWNYVMVRLTSDTGTVVLAECLRRDLIDGQPIVCEWTADRPPALLKVLGHPRQSVMAQNFIGVNGYVYGPFCSQEEEVAGSAFGVHESNFPTGRLFLAGKTFQSNGQYAWARVTAAVQASSPGYDPYRQPLLAMCDYRVFNLEWPGGSPWFSAGSALAPDGGSATDPQLHMDNIAAGGWQRCDGMGTNTINERWLMPPAWSPFESAGSLRFEIVYQVAFHGSYAITAYIQASIRRGGALPPPSPMRGPLTVRANAFRSIPGYPG
jgi:hypothetical protein